MLGGVYPGMSAREACWVLYTGYVSQGGMLGVLYPPGHAGRCISHPDMQGGVYPTRGTCGVLITRVHAGC